MAKLQPSLLDRLTDHHPEKKKESTSQQQLSQQDYKDAVIRDLAWLLNTYSNAEMDGLDVVKAVKEVL